MTHDQTTHASPLDEDAYQALKSRLEATYLRRRSDQALSAFLNQALPDRATWKERRDELHAVEQRISNADDNGVEPDPLDLAEAARLTKLVQAYKPRGFAATGESGAGKSRLMDEAFLRIGTDMRRRGRIIPLLRYELPAPCTLMRLGHELLACLGYPAQGRLLEHEVWNLVREHLVMAKVDILYLDEIQNVTQGAKVHEAKRILDTIKTLIKRREHPVIVVLTGLPTFDDFVEGDTQVSRKIDFVPLETLSVADAPMITMALKRLVAIADLSVDDTLLDMLVPRLIHAGQNQFGITMEIAVASVLRAVRPLDPSGAHLPSACRLDMEHFARAFAGRSGNAGFANPFVTPDWHAVDVSRVNVVSPSQVRSGDGTPLDTDRPRRNRGKARS